MSAELISSFKQYRTTVDIERIRLSAVPAELQPLVKAYREALSSYLADPENESWASLGPNERYNALQAVYHKFGAQPERTRGNCSRCGGSGYILAYSHIQGGRCLRCDGTGSVNIKVDPAESATMQNGFAPRSPS